jgi:hypothetical protein
MIAAANAVFLDLAVVERGTTAAAACVKQAGAAVLSRNRMEILAERANLSGDIAGVGDEPDRVPWCSPTC